MVGLDLTPFTMREVDKTNWATDDSYTVVVFTCNFLIYFVIAFLFFRISRDEKNLRCPKCCKRWIKKIWLTIQFQVFNAKKKYKLKSEWNWYLKNAHDQDRQVPKHSLQWKQLWKQSMQQDQSNTNLDRLLLHVISIQTLQVLLLIHSKPTFQNHKTPS